MVDTVDHNDDKEIIKIIGLMKGLIIKSRRKKILDLRFFPYRE